MLCDRLIEGQGGVHRPPPPIGRDRTPFPPGPHPGSGALHLQTTTPYQRRRGPLGPLVAHEAGGRRPAVVPWVNKGEHIRSKQARFGGHGKRTSLLGTVSRGDMSPLRSRDEVRARDRKSACCLGPSSVRSVGVRCASEVASPRRGSHESWRVDCAPRSPTYA